MALPAKIASPAKVQQSYTAQVQGQADHKMDTFLDEMRTQFLQTGAAQTVPQSLLFQQTRLMEKQVQVLEQNQRSMTDVINNVLNQNATGPGSAANLR